MADWNQYQGRFNDLEAERLFLLSRIATSLESIAGSLNDIGREYVVGKNYNITSGVAYSQT